MDMLLRRLSNDKLPLRAPEKTDCRLVLMPRLEGRRRTLGLLIGLSDPRRTLGPLLEYESGGMLTPLLGLSGGDGLDGLLPLLRERLLGLTERLRMERGADITLGGRKRGTSKLDGVRAVKQVCFQYSFNLQISVRCQDTMYIRTRRQTSYRPDHRSGHL